MVGRDCEEEGGLFLLLILAFGLGFDGFVGTSFLID